ncbi:hypothetical protein [Rhodococcus sp. RS1C4]|nr:MULTISPECIES: hypothetical protein [unclassified Rhodococcus (in: high G+C Gram-positive bacteria)]
MTDPRNTPEYRRVLDAVDRLRAARLRADATPIHVDQGPVVVDEALLERISQARTASPELRTYGVRVASGSSTWDRIEFDAVPIPPEVEQMKADPRIVWPRHWPLPQEDQPYSIPWQ